MDSGTVDEQFAFYVGVNGVQCIFYGGIVPETGENDV